MYVLYIFHIQIYICHIQLYASYIRQKRTITCLYIDLGHISYKTRISYSSDKLVMLPWGRYNKEEPNYKIKSSGSRTSLIVERSVFVITYFIT